MKKGFKNLLAVVLTVFTLALAGVLYGCGDPYKNARISITTSTNIDLSIDAAGNAESTSVSVKVSGMPKGSSNQVISKEIDKDIAYIDEDSVEYNESTGITTFNIVANKGGEAKLVVKAEGGKESTATIVVEERLQNFSFNNSYKPTIFVGKAFSVDLFGLNFKNETATNKNVNLDIQRATSNGYVTVATLTNGVLTSTQTRNLNTAETYYLRGITVDGSYTDRIRVAVVKEIDVNDIEIYLNNSTDNLPVKEITLATNIDSLTSKTFYIDVKGLSNLKYEVTTNNEDLICKVAQDNVDPSIFTVTKQNRGISKVTVRVGYEDSFDYYSVAKDYEVQVYSEPKNIVINGLTKDENDAESFNVFSVDNEWQLVDISIDPTETNYKDIKISYLSDNYRKGYIRFGAQDSAGNIVELKFEQNGDYVFAKYDSTYKLYVSIVDREAAVNNENFNVTFTSDRNAQATRTVKFYAREQISGFKLTSGVINNVDINNNGNLVDIIFAPINSAVTVVEFSYETGYGDISLIYNKNRFTASEVTIDRNAKTGYFTVSGILDKSVNTLEIYNGNNLQTSIEVVAAIATSSNVQVSVNTNNSLAILTDRNEYREMVGYDRYIAYNNEAGTAPVEIRLTFSDEVASVLNYSANIEKVNNEDTNEISYVNNTLLVSNKTAEAKAYLTFKLMFFVLDYGELNAYRVEQFDYKILINYSPELAEDMVAFAFYQNDKAINYAELVDYTTAGDMAEKASILDLELFVAGDSTGSFFAIKSIDFVLPAGAAKYLTVKEGLTPSESGRYRFQILAGELERNSEQFVITFYILQEGRTQPIEKQFVILVNKLTNVTEIQLDKSVNVSVGGNGGSEIYQVMQLGENGETENIKVVNANNLNENVSFNNLEVSIVAVEPNDYSKELTEGTLPININNGVITRVGEGAAKVSIKLKNTVTLDKNKWLETGSFDYIINSYNSIEFIVKCYGANVAKDIFTANDFASISSTGKFSIANNIDLTGVKFNLARFNEGSELDGNNYIIYGLNQNSALFNLNYGTIKNFNLIINQVVDSNKGILGAICQTNYGAIENVDVTAIVDVATESKFIYGAIAAENNASITVANADVVIKLVNGGSGVVGAVCGVNNGLIDSYYAEDATSTETTPDVTLTVIGNNLKTFFVGGVAGRNNKSISDIKSEAIVNGNELDNIVVGGVVGLDNNGFYNNISGSLVTTNKVLSGGLIVGRANNNINLTSVKGVVRLNTTGEGNNMVASSAFSAINAGGIVGEAYKTITINPNAYVVGFAISNVDDASTGEASTLISQFSGDYAGGIAGKAAEININSSELYSVSFEDVNIVGTTLSGVIAGSIGETVVLDDNNEENYIFDAYYKENESAYELTTEATNNTPLTDANGKAVYIFENGVKTQLYYNNARPIFEIAEEVGGVVGEGGSADSGIIISASWLTLGVGGVNVDFGYKVYNYNNNTQTIGNLLLNSYVKLNLTGANAGEYTLVTSAGNYNLTQVSGDYNETIYSYTSGGTTLYVYVNEDETVVASSNANIIDVSQNEFGNYVTSDDVIIASDVQAKHANQQLINYNGKQVYSYAYAAKASNINAAVKLAQNSTVMLNDNKVAVNGENIINNNLYYGNKTVTRSRAALASAYSFDGTTNASKANIAELIVGGNSENVVREPEFIAPNDLENGVGSQSNYISTLGPNASYGEIYGIGTTGTSDLPVMYVLLSDVNSTTIFNLAGLISNLNYYKVGVNSTNNIAALYSNTLVVNGAGTIALTLTPYSSINAASYIMLIRVVQKPDATIYSKTLSGQVENINNNDVKQLTSGSEFVFYADNVMSPKFSVSETNDNIVQAGNKYIVTLSGSTTNVNFSDSVKFESDLINVGGVEYVIDNFEVEYRQWTFTINKGYNLEFVSATLSNAQITKNDEVYLTLKIKVYGHVEDYLSIVNALDFSNEVVGNGSKPEIAYQIVNSSEVRDSEANTSTITVNVLYYIANKSVSINSGYTANLTVSAGDVSTKVELKIVPQTITYLEDVLTPLYGKQVYTEGSVIFDKVAAEVVLTPAYFYNDVNSINVTVSVTVAGNPDITYGTSIVSATGSTLGGSNYLQVGKHNVLDNNYNKFVFYVYISARQSMSNENIKNSIVTLNITWGKNNEYSQVISYKVSQIPDMQFDTSVPYYAIGGDKELTVVNSAGEKINNLAEIKEFYAFGVEAINGKEIFQPYNDNINENSLYYYGTSNSTTYIQRLKNGAGIFVSSLSIGTDVTLGIYANVNIGNGREERLLVNRFTITIVEYTIESINFTTPGGLQPLDQEIPIDFNVEISYSSAYVSNERVEQIKKSIINKLKSYWSVESVTDSTARYIELIYMGRTADGSVGESILRTKGKYYYGVENGSAKFLVIPKVNDDNTFGNGYRIWGAVVNTPLTIQLRTYIVYRDGEPEIQIYNDVDHANHIMLTSEFNFEFYQLSTEENPTPINNKEQFLSLLSSETSVNEHFRLMDNIVLSDYTPIAANFASFDGNGFVIYLESFAVDKTATSDISLGLFSSIGEGVLVKNVSLAVGALKTVGETSSIIDIKNYSSATIGLLTPENHGYIANCEVVNFDLTSKSPVNTTITISTAYGADVVVGGLVAHNYGSVVNSRVGRSINSDYKYLGFFTNSSGIDNQFKIADETASRFERFENGINISASGTIGGLVAYNHKTENETGIISSSYFVASTITNTASVVETSFTGGLAAFNEGQIALSSAEGQFSNTQANPNIKNKDMLVRLGAGISSNGNIGGFVYKNSGTISDCYSNITLNTNARSAAFVYNTEEGVVDNAYAYSSNSSTTNNAPFVGLEPFETVYLGTITNSYYFTLSSSDVAADASSNNNLDNTNLITKIPDASSAKTDTTYTSFAFSQISYNDLGEEINAENGVWKFTEASGPILTSANAIAVSKYKLKTNVFDDISSLPFVDEKFDLSLISNAAGYIAVSSNGVFDDENFEINNYIFIKNAAEFNDRILNGENEYQSNIANNKNVSKKVYRLISNITFGASGSSGATIGTSTLQFEGILDGNGLNIYNLVITDSTISDTSETTQKLIYNKYLPSDLAVGMFAAMANGATVKNLNIYVTQVAAAKADAVGSLVGILENSFVYNINVLPFGEISTNENRITGSYVAAGAIGMVLGDVTNFKIANVSSSVSVTAASTNKPKITEINGVETSKFNDISETANQIYGGFTDDEGNVIKELTLNDLYGYRNSDKAYVKTAKYNGLSIAAGVIGVTDVTEDDSNATNNVISQINNGIGNNVRLAQISRIKAGGDDLRLTATNSGGVIGIIDNNVFVHDVEFTVSKYEGVETSQKIGGVLTLGGISIVNSGLIKYARIVHENQFELDRIYLNAEGQYNYAQNSTRSLFAFTRDGVSDIFNNYVGGIAAINNVGEIVDSYVKVDLMPTVDTIYATNGYIGFVSGLSIGGRISYFYSLADIDGANFTAGLIGYAAKNSNGTYAFNSSTQKPAFMEYQQEMVKHNVEDVPYIVVNTASIIVPTDTSVANLQYKKYYTLAGYANSKDIFGDQEEDKNVTLGTAGNIAYQTTLKNINFTNIGTTVSVSSEVATATDKLVGGNNSSENYYMQKGIISAEEFVKVCTPYKVESGVAVLDFGGGNVGGADYQTLVLARASATFEQFLETLRWNVFTTERMPFPFYGISQNLQEITTADDFKKIAEYPDRVFVIKPKQSEEGYFIDITSKDLEACSKVQFSGILTGREITDDTGNIKKPTLKITLDGENGASIVANVLDASLYNFNIELSTGDQYSMTRGLFGSNATNTLFENIKIYVNNNLRVNANGNGEAGNVGLLVGNLKTGSLVRNVGVESKPEKDATIATIHVSGENGSFGAVAGSMQGAVASFSDSTISNLNINATNKLNNVGGAFGKIINSTISGLDAQNITINNGGTNVGGIVGYAETSTISAVSLSGANLTGSNVGGIVGNAKQCSIKNCYSKAGTNNADAVRGSNYAGGFAGILDGGFVSYSFSTLNINGSQYAGGFVGKTSATISNCYAIGNINTTTYAGGFAAEIVGGSIENCYSTGEVAGTSIAGGFASNSSGKFTIKNCFTLSKVTGATSIKNFIASYTFDPDQNVENCYYASELNYKAILKNTENTYKIKDDEFYVGENKSGEINGVEARSLSKFFNTASSSDFTITGFYKSGNVNTDDIVYTFRIDGGNEEFIKNQANNSMLKAAVVNAEKDSIKNKSSKIYLLRQYYQATTNGTLIDNLYGKIVVGAEIGETAYHAYINGNTPLFNEVRNSIITNIKVFVSSAENNRNARGAIANTVSGSILNKIFVNGSLNFNASEQYIGAIAGNLEGNSLLINSHNNATVNSQYNIVGGLIGGLNNSTIITCYNAGDVSGNNTIGGLVGVTSFGTIYKCYNVGKIFGNYYISGLVGGVSDLTLLGGPVKIENSYNTGLITGNKYMAGIAYANSSNREDLTITNVYNTGAINNPAGNSSYYPVTNKTLTTSDLNCYYNSDLFPEVVVGDANMKREGIAKTTTELAKLTKQDFDNNSDFEFLTNEIIETKKVYSFPLLKGVGGISNKTEVGGQIKGVGANLITVNTGADLVRDDAFTPTASFIVVSDFDADGVGNYNYAFTGTIYGCNHTIYNLNKSLLTNNALNATICNLRFVGTNIDDPNNPSLTLRGDMGAPIANEFDGGFISNVIFTGELNAHLASQASNSYYAGGIVGKSDNSTILYCNVIETDIFQYFNVGNASSNSRTAYIGGIVGSATNSYINKNTYSGNIHLGRGFFENSVGFADVTQFHVGGVVGYNSESKVKHNTVQHQVFYAKNIDDGGLAADIELKSEGLNPIVSGTGNNQTSATAFVYNVSSGITANANNDDTRSVRLQNITDGIAAFSNINTSLTIDSTTKLGNTNTKIKITNLIASIMPDADKKWGSTYKLSKLIYNVDQFKNILKDNNNYYKLVCNISEIGNFYKEKTPKNFDGRGYVLGGITGTGAMFGSVAENTTFKNVVLKNVAITNNVKGPGNSAVLAKINNGTIKYVGIINSTLDVTNDLDGGDINSSTYKSTIPNFSQVESYNAGSVGGLVGNNETGTIAYCYSMAQINIVGATIGNVGGLVGLNSTKDSKVVYSYGSGLISFPYKASTATNGFASGGAIGAIGQNSGSVTGVYSNSDIMIADEDKTASAFGSVGKPVIRKTASQIRINNFNSITIGNALKTKNAGMPMLNKHKNFELYNPYAFNWKASEKIQGNYTTISNLDDFKKINGAENNKVYCLTNNILISNPISENYLIEKFGGKLYFNGYSIIGYKMNTSGISAGLFKSLCLFDSKGSSVYDVCMVNPQVTLNVLTDNIVKDHIFGWRADFLTEINVGVLASESCHGKLYNANILGGYTNVICDDFTANGLSTITGSLSSKSITLPTINIDAVNPKNKKNVTINNGYAYSSSIYVKTAGANTQDVKPNGATLFNVMSFDEYKRIGDFPRGTSHNFDWDWSRGYYQSKITKDISTGSIDLGEIILSNAQNNGSNIISICESKATTGDTYTRSWSTSYIGTGNSIKTAYQNLINHMRGEYTLGTEKTGSISGVRVIGGAKNNKMMYAYSGYTKPGEATGSLPIYRIGYEWHQKESHPLQDLGTYQYNIRGDEKDYYFKGGYTRFIE